MRILHVIGTLSIKHGGTYTALMSIMQMFDRLGYENELITTIDSLNSNADYDKNYFQSRLIVFNKSFPARFKKSVTALKWLNQNIANYNVVIVHEIWTGIGLDACKVAYDKNITYHIWPHGSLDPFDLKKKKLLKKLVGFVLLNKILCKAKYICCTSQLEQELLEYFGKKNNNSIVLPLPVDYVTNIDLIKNIPVQFRNKYQIPKDTFVFLFLSRINYKKGLDIIIESLNELLIEKLLPVDQVKLVIAGDEATEYATHIKNLVTKYNLQNNVLFVGMLSGINKIVAFKESNVFLLPSKNENFGLAIVESLQVGLPIIISKNIYIYKNLFNSEKPGWMCGEGTVDEVKSAMQDAFYNMDNNIMKNSALQVGRQFMTEYLLSKYRVIFE